jgi:septal ring factor EnvC (AmiA/AmiB activator)
MLTVMIAPETLSPSTTVRGFSVYNIDDMKANLADLNDSMKFVTSCKNTIASLVKAIESQHKRMHGLEKAITEVAAEVQRVKENLESTNEYINRMQNPGDE